MLGCEVFCELPVITGDIKWGQNAEAKAKTRKA